MNFNQKQARNAGITLIGLGLVALFHLWWALPPALLVTGGVLIYQRQKARGHTGAAVQAVLWGVGLAVLLLAHFIMPGVLLLGGTSLLMRGREAAVEAEVFALVGRFSRRRAPVAPLAPVMGAPTTPQRVTIVETREVASGTETTRLH